MYKITKTLVCVFMFVVPMISCKKNAALQSTIVNDSLCQVITMNPDNINRKEPGKISAFADGVEYIPLQTADSILIGEITRLIVWNDLYYIWDKLSETIFCFAQDGSFQYRVNRQGEGPSEYLNISDFTLNRENGNLMIYSDRAQTLYEYTTGGELVKKSEIPFLMSSFAAKGDWKYCYLGRLPNRQLYEDIFPESYRYVTLNDGNVCNQHFKYEYNKDFLNVPLSSNNFTYYKDKILLTEFLCPAVYEIDSLGNLIPRYRIEFTTNTYVPSFNESIDLRRMKEAEKEGEYTSLFGAFYENENYLFFNYSRGLIALAYVDKKDDSIHNPGYFLLDDFNQNTLSVTLASVDEKYVYLLEEPGLLKEKQRRKQLSSCLSELCENMQEFDNPVIIRAKLK